MAQDADRLRLDFIAGAARRLSRRDRISQRMCSISQDEHRRKAGPKESTAVSTFTSEALDEDLGGG